MGIQVDEALCVGTGQCEMTLPEVFAVGDGGTVEVDHAAAVGAPVDQLRRAVRLCPTGALSLEE